MPISVKGRYRDFIKRLIAATKKNNKRRNS